MLAGIDRPAEHPCTAYIIAIIAVGSCLDQDFRKGAHE